VSRYDLRDMGYETVCWIWTGAFNDRGYGKCWDSDRGYSRGAHRVMWEKYRGPVADGYELDHLCRQRACVRPTHLNVVTHKENMRRGYAVSRGTAREGIAGSIKRYRLAERLSQADLAERLGCSQPLIALWESGKAKPPAARLDQLADLTREESGS
jgi:DNA-binding transcriptional regulator YiaG